MSSISVLTVSHAKDTLSLLWLIRSLNRHLDPEITELTIVVQGPDDDLPSFRALIASIKNLRLHIQLVPQSDLLPRCPQALPHGWFVQQYLKIAAAARSPSQWVWVLDSKHVFFRSIERASLIQGERALMPFSNQSSHLGAGRGDAYVFCYGLFGLDPVAHIANTLPTVTPYMFNSAAVRGLVAHVERSQGTPFLAFFLAHHQRVTEFYLYSAFIDAAGTTDQLYQRSISRDLIIWNAEDLAPTLHRIQTNPSIRSAALHRGLIQSAAPDQLQHLLDHLAHLGAPIKS